MPDFQGINKLKSQLSKGEESAWKILYSNFYPFLCSFAQRVGITKSEAEEIVQNIIFKLWNNRERISEIENIEAYLIRSVKNEALLTLKNNKKLKENTSELYYAIKSIELEFHDQFYQSELIDEMQNAIGNLPPKSKEAFVLKRIHGKSLEEIAGIMNISVKGVERNITRALAELKTVLKNCFVFFL